MLEFIENKLKEMKRIRPSRIEKYAEIRSKLVAHYDDQIVNILQELGAIQSDIFFEDIEMMVRFSQEWLQALRSIGKLEVPENAV
jgi:ribosome maturation protein Sdo1